MKYATWLLIGAVVAGLSACSEPHKHVWTVDELLAEPAILDGIIVRCNGALDHAQRDRECATARAAIERRALAQDDQQAAKHEQEFEKNREKARIALEQRDAAKREPPFDPYTAPVVQDPVKPADAPPP